MNLKPDWHKLASEGQRLMSGWQKILQKCLPYVLVAIFASATVFAVLAAQDTNQVYMSIEESRNQLEAEQQALEANKQELSQALTETQKLLNQLNAINSDTQDLLQEAERTEEEVSDKIEQLQSTFDETQNREQQRWILPIRYVMITSPFGYREHPVEGEAKFHYGVDLAAPEGTPIVASRSGTVKIATYGDNEGYYVQIDHLDGYTSYYLHMSKYIVAPDQFVMAGQVIGYCGSTGVSTGPHLHFSIYHNGNIVDPAKYIDI